MDFFCDFKEELKIVFEAVGNKLSSYPGPFNKDAMTYLGRYNIFDDGFNGNHMCFLLPFWLKKESGLDNETCRTMSEGFIFGLLYFIVQDIVMDSASGEYKGDLLPLGNLFYLDFIEKYQGLFPGNHVFWKYFRKYIDEWAYSVKWEQNEHWIQKKAYIENDLILVARKAAPLKIPAAAACMLGGNEHSAANLSTIVDHITITFQLMDDWGDWRKDYESGICTYFIWEVMKYCGIDDFSHIREAHVNKAVYSGRILDEMLELVKKNHSIVKEISYNYPYLIAYHEMLERKFENMVFKVYEKRYNELKGGFIRLLGDMPSFSK